MTLLSPHDDFVIRTLGALGGCWRRLLYVSALRGESGAYSHWGFVRLHGEDKAQAAMHQAHKEVFREVLRRPVPQLIAEERSEESSQELRPELLAPSDAGRAARLHLNAVLFAIEQTRHAKHPSA